MKIRLAARLARLTLDPGARSLPFTSAHGLAFLPLPALAIHAILSIAP